MQEILGDLQSKTESLLKKKAINNMNTHTEPGRGRKQCPSCKIYVGVRTGKCACGHVFEKPVVEVKAETKTETGSEASQPQPEVKAEEPPSKPAEAKPAKPAKPVVAAQKYSFDSGPVLIPAGKCPVELTGTDEQSVVQWRDAVKKHYQADGQEITDTGVAYYVSTIYNRGTTEYSAVMNILQPKP